MTQGLSYLAGALVFTSIGQLMFKIGVDRSHRLSTVIGLCSLLGAAVMNLLALRTLGLGLVYLTVGLSHVIVMVLSLRVLHETITPTRWVGAGLIICGVTLYAASVL
jgi:drug/metabolite transporter (DMT)-like permease